MSCVVTVLGFLPSSAIDKTEFSTSQSSSLSVSMAFFTVFETVLSSINFVTWQTKSRQNQIRWDLWQKPDMPELCNFLILDWRNWLGWCWTSLREFILVEKWGVLSMRSNVSSRRSSTTVTSSLWNLMHSSLMADSRSGMLTRRWHKSDKQRKEWGHDIRQGKKSIVF